MKTVIAGNRTISPSKIICIGRNYIEHIEELGNAIPDEMVMFLKPNSAISDNLLATHNEQLHYEGEISFLYENGGIPGVAFGFDLTKRDLQSKLRSKGLPWARAKAFDGSAVFSEFVEFSGDTGSLALRLDINDVTVQSAGTEMMIYKPDVVLEILSKFITLVDGDIIMTGTPGGAGAINAGDTFTGSILENDNLLVSKTWIAKP